jgi:hypothetical protein
MTEIELYKKYVDPIYLTLIGTTILQETKEEKDEFREKFKNIVIQADDQIIKLLLRNSNWRFSLVGGVDLLCENQI